MNAIQFLALLDQKFPQMMKALRIVAEETQDADQLATLMADDKDIVSLRRVHFPGGRLWMVAELL